MKNLSAMFLIVFFVVLSIHPSVGSLNMALKDNDADDVIGLIASKLKAVPNKIKKDNPNKNFDKLIADAKKGGGVDIFAKLSSDEQKDFNNKYLALYGKGSLASKVEPVGLNAAKQASKGTNQAIANLIGSMGI